jgi:hypothetical protein
MSALIKARAADDLMDVSIDDYITRRKELMTRYLGLRKSKTEFKEDMWDISPIKIFLQEREYNSSFNKSLLSNPDIGEILKQRWPALRSTSAPAIPYFMEAAKTKDGEQEENCNVIGSVRVASNILKSPQANKLLTRDGEIAMILLYDSSNYKQGISKKGKAWHKVSVMLSDGYNMLEAVKWDAKKALGWSKDTIVYVRGVIKEGWSTSISITISEIEKIE